MSLAWFNISAWALLMLLMLLELLLWIQHLGNTRLNRDKQVTRYYLEPYYRQQIGWLRFPWEFYITLIRNQGRDPEAKIYYWLKRGRKRRHLIGFSQCNNVRQYAKCIWLTHLRSLTNRQTVWQHLGFKQKENTAVPSKTPTVFIKLLKID